MTNTTLSIVTDQLRQYPDVKIIYVNRLENNIKCTVIRDTLNITEDKPTCISIIANLEIAKELFSKSNITFDYEIKTNLQFKNELNEKDSNTKKEYNTAEVIYKRKNKTR